MKITERRQGLISILDLEGDLNESHCPQLQKAIRRLFGEGRFWILINLEKVAFLGSHALGILLFADHEARESQGRIKLMKPQPLVRMVFQSTRTKFLLEIFDNEETALASF